MTPIMMLAYILLGAVFGFVFALLMLWIEQLGGIAQNKSMRDELNRMRAEQKKSLHAQGAEESRSDGSVKETVNPS